MYSSPYKAAIFYTASILALTNAPAAWAEEMNIPSSDMRKALDVFIKQTGVQLVYASDDIVGVKSNAIYGQYGPEAALEKMLEGTQLVVTWYGGGAAIVSKRLYQVPVRDDDGAKVPEIVIPETVVVTGSRVISNIADSPSPVTTMSVTQLLATSPAGINSALDKLPDFVGSTGNGTNRAGGNSNGAASNLNLRDFGTNRTLVLFDSHRVVNTQANGAVNTDTLPEMLMQRVDVVTGGASAVYGSDAVTGVVNFILDKNFDGIKYDLSAGTNDDLLGTQIRLGVAAGASLFGGRGHIEGTLRYTHTDQVLISDLPYGRNGQAWAYDGTGSKAAPYFLISQARLNTAPFGGLIGCSGCVANGETFVQNGVIGPYDIGTIPSAAVSTLSNGGTGGYTAFGALGPESHTAESFGRFSYDINDNVVASLEARASEAQYYNLGGFNNITVGNRPNTFAVTNPYLPAAAQAALAAGNPGCPGGVPTSITIAPGCTFTLINVFGTLDGISPSNPTGNTNEQSPNVPTGLPDFMYQDVDREMAVTADLTGSVSNRWDWDLFYTHDEAREKSTSVQNENFQDAYAADDAVQLPNGQIACYVSTTAYAANYPGCTPINPFGPSSITPIEYASLIAQTHYIMTNKMDDLGGSIAGDIFDLPAGPVKAALSAESRWMSYEVVSSAYPGSVPNCDGLRMCSTGSILWYQPVLASIPAKNESVYEFAGEVNVPLLKAVPLVQNLSLDLAGRYTDYSVSGSVETWKIGFDWHVIDDLKFRGTVSVDIRAPTLNDLYQPAIESSTGINDILTGGRGDIDTFTSGNPNLKPEVAHTYTVGTALTPSFIPNLIASVDYYRIDLYDAITALTYATVAIQQICIASGGASPYCILVTRPYPIANTTLANFPTSYTNESLNSATQKTEGIDFEIDYNFDLDDAVGLPGDVQLKNLLSYQPFVTNVAFPGATPIWTAMPKGRDTLFAGYKLGAWGVNLQDRYLSGWDQNTAPGQYFLTPSDRHVSEYNQVDITVDRSIIMDDIVTDFYLSIQDIANTLYPLSPGLTSSTNPGSSYPVADGNGGGGFGYSLGRYITIGVRGNF